MYYMTHDNVREILETAGMNHGFTAFMGFVGGVCLFWESSKVFLVPLKFEQRHITFVVKVNFAVVVLGKHVQFVFIFFALNNTLFTSTTAVAYGADLTLYTCREFDYDATSTTTTASGPLICIYS